MSWDLDKKDLSGQSGMERAMRGCAEIVGKGQGGEYNALLAPVFVSCDFEARRATFEFPVREWTRNPIGIMHGGAIAGALDFGMGVVARYFSGGSMTPTLDMDVKFLHSVPAGGVFVVEAECSSCGRTLAGVTAKGWEKNRPERLCATASGMYFLRFEA